MRKTFNPLLHYNQHRIVKIREVCNVSENPQSTISFIIPCYKSEGSVGLVIQEIREVVAQRPEFDYQIVAVNDCSPDGLLEVIKRNGGIDFIIRQFTRHISGKRGAELSIAALVSIVNLCTANNTVSIITVGGIAHQIGEKYGLDPRKCASLLDTFSCTVQGLIPYGAQLLMAAGLAAVNPIDILPSLCYPVAIGICALLAIFLRYPRRYSEVK